MLKELADGVYVETGYEGGNVGLVLTERGALLVDTPMLPPQAQQWRRTIQELGVSQIYGVVSTDYHLEHILGDAAFMPALLWGHELALRQIAKYKAATLDQVGGLYREEHPALADEINQVDLYAPELGVSDRVTLHLEQRRIEILHLNGHTPASLGVYLPAERILFAGDNVTNNEHPIMYQANSLAWLDTLERLRQMELRVVVPGSGDVGGSELLAPLIKYIGEMRERVAELYRSGASRRECVDRVGMIEFFPVPEAQAAQIKRRRRENVERVYAEIRTAQPRA